MTVEEIKDVLTTYLILNSSGDSVINSWKIDEIAEELAKKINPPTGFEHFKESFITY